MRLVALSFAAALLFAATGAAAQSSTPPPTSTASPNFLPVGGEPTSLSGFRASSPLRLSLEASVFPIGGQFPQCQGLGDEAGNSVGGIPVQSYQEVTLVPHLVLSGFSQLGCPIDAGIGGSLTYSVPLRSSSWLVFGAGAYGVPPRVPLYGSLGNALDPRLLAPPISTSMRADVVWAAPNGRTFNIGVETRGLVRQTVSFGSTF